MSNDICQKCQVVLCESNQYPSHKASGASICKDCHNKRTTITNSAPHRRKYASDKRLEQKSEVINHYGGKCACCGITDMDLLAIDHIDGGGTKHRQEIGVSAGAQFYDWLRKNDYPQGFRVLCHNCNCALGHYGYCPHQHTRTITKVAHKRKSVKGQCRVCNIILDDNNQYAHHRKDGKNICKECFQADASNKLYEQKCKIVSKYGGQCMGCDEKSVEFLTLDHIDNSGLQHRKEVGVGAAFYRWVIKNNFPKDNLQLLCHNCNMLKEIQRRRISFQ